LAELLRAQGNYDAARPLYERALAIRERVLGPEHPDTATSLNNLAGLYGAQGNYDAARPLYERALDIRERVLGPEHPATARSLNDLAINYCYQGDLATSERLMHRALQIRETRLGPDHPNTQGSRQSLAVIQQQRGRLATPQPSDPREALAPLLVAIAAVATGDNAPRQEVTEALADLEQQGWRLREPIERIWAGERDRAALVAGLADQDTALIDRVLALIERRQALLTSLPEALRTALREGNAVALQAALEALPEDQRHAVLAQLQEAGIIGGGPDMGAVLREFEPLLQAIAAVANGDEGPRAEIEAVLPQREAQGWQLTSAVQRIWVGERDEARLTEGIDANSAMLVRRILVLLNHPEPAVPSSIRDALATGNPQAIQTALEALEPDERTRVEAWLRTEAEQVMDALTRRSPDELVAGLPPAVRSALAQQDNDAFEAALAALPEAERQQVMVDLSALQAHAVRASQQQDPLERFAPLLAAIAAVANGDEGPREEVTAALVQSEQQGWMLRGPAERIWAGERDRAALVVGLDDQDAALIERVLALIASP
ncbi:tetratricopeptide repeat protein, partial [Candidatus Chloroploca sp. M-50]